ncbi:hypothetical protein DFA_11584 [Cavenderia fasciculata]|uniref:MACPF domain-containing protein n=1 Tax=Cavenderia fasciculata TaxID=261658 RepID=F4QDM6_CACFS|nr:uncharacterized protein DFA_11584 [Cavenderia fasciculata]EGG13823.1 hypothetical protein DFA_11584 [Cavenderia fasciculata]|eukprot:XP_004350531.1 hypothetical protein DFA_11584 [Cavenderia fasciculata]
MKAIFIVIYLVILLFYAPYFHAREVFYARQGSGCQVHCGTSDFPFPNIQAAIEAISHVDNPILILEPGLYQGDLNIEINLDFSLDIRSSHGLNQTKIDCQSLTYAFFITGESVSIQGITISNCFSNYGGAIKIQGTNVYLDSVVLFNNSALVGGAIHASSSNVEISNSQFHHNTAIVEGSALSFNSSTSNIVQTLVKYPTLVYAGNTSCDGISTITKSFVPYPKLDSFMDDIQCPVSGVMKSFIQVNETFSYDFHLLASNIGVAVYIDNVLLFNSYFVTESIDSERSIILGTNQNHKVIIYLFSITSGTRSFSLTWRRTDRQSFQPIVSYSIEDNYPAPWCGDGICNEIPESCLRDCFEQIAVECQAQATPKPLYENYKKDSDIVGSLLNNQYRFTLPGLNFMGHGVDLLSMKETAAPLFNLGYCTGDPITTAQDLPHGLVYTIPKGFSGHINSKCEYEAKSESYSSAQEMSYEKSVNMGLDTSLSGSGGWFTKVSLSMSMSISESVQEAKELESQTSGSIFSTEMKCEVSKVQMSSFNFHPKFVQDISQVFDTEAMKKVVKKYGVFYKKSATLGGSLEQITSVSSSLINSRSSNSLDKSMSLSFDASVSSSAFGASGSVSLAGSLTSQVSEEEQSQYESNTERTTLIVKGGAPGSYGANTQVPLQKWLKSVPLNPVPIDFQVGLVSDIIPSEWYSSNQTNIKQLWIQAQEELYSSIFWESYSNPLFQQPNTTSPNFTPIVWVAGFYSSVPSFDFSANLTFTSENNVTSKINNLKVLSMTPTSMDFPQGVGIKSLDIGIIKPSSIIVNNRTNWANSPSNCAFSDPSTNEFYDLGDLIKFNGNFYSMRNGTGGAGGIYLNIVNLCDTLWICTSNVTGSSNGDLVGCQFDDQRSDKLYSYPTGDANKFTNITRYQNGTDRGLTITYSTPKTYPNQGNCYDTRTLKVHVVCDPAVNDGSLTRYWEDETKKFSKESVSLVCEEMVLTEYRRFDELGGVITFDPKQYPGRIIGVKLQPIPYYKNMNINFTLSVDSLSVVQQCPDREEISTNCVDDTYTSITNGYSKVYVSTTTKPYVVNNLDRGPVFIPIDPMGKSNSKYYDLLNR